MPKHTLTTTTTYNNNNNNSNWGVFTIYQMHSETFHELTNIHKNLALGMLW